MSAITNQSWKQAAMDRAESLTDIWDVFKAWMGRAAEIVLTLCMFAQLIGMLPGVAYPVIINNIILGVQIIMLDFGAFALVPLAEQARNVGQVDAAKKAENMATFLIRLVIFTMLIIIIGQFAVIFGSYAKYITGFVKYAEPALILVRVGCVVKYIHVIHSLRGSAALSIQPIHVPTQSSEIDELKEALKDLQNQLKNVQPIHVPTQPTQPPIHVVEVPTQHLHKPTQALKINFSGLGTSYQGVKMLSQVASCTEIDDIVEEMVIPDEIAIEADASVVILPIEKVYPVVTGVSVEKVKQLIDLFEAGDKWRDLPGNYSQTIKPVKEAYELLHTSTHVPTQPIQNV